MVLMLACSAVIWDAIVTIWASMASSLLATVELEPPPPMPHVLHSVASRHLALVKRTTPIWENEERERGGGDRGVVRF